MMWVWVFLGGGLGALARYGLTVILPRPPDGFPWATLTANLIGALLIGILVGTLAGRESARLFLIVGILGGFTTFSAFSLEVLQLIQNRDFGAAVTYVLLSVFAGVLACWVGLKVADHA